MRMNEYVREWAYEDSIKNLAKVLQETPDEDEQAALNRIIRELKELKGE